MISAHEKAKKWREAQGYTLKEAGDRLGFAIGYISDLENGKRPFTRKVITSYLSIAPDFFTANDFFPPPKKSAGGSRRSSHA